MSYRKQYNLTLIRPVKFYTPARLALLLGMNVKTGADYIRSLCRQKRLPYRVDAKGKWWIRGKDALAWRVATQTQRGTISMVKWRKPVTTRYGMVIA